MSCAPVAIPLVLGILGLLLCLVTVAVVEVRRRRIYQQFQDTHTHQQVRRVRAGALPTPSQPEAHPQRLSMRRLFAIEEHARVTARADFRLGRKRANPHVRHSHAFVHWALSYADEWERLANPAPLDNSEEFTGGFAPTHPHPGASHGAA